jgi:hypothetical protein
MDPIGMTVLMIASAVIAAGLWQAVENDTTSYMDRRRHERERDERRT